MSEDYAKKGISNNYLRINAVLLQIKHLLEQHHKSLNEYDLLPLTSSDNNPNELPKLLFSELNIPVTDEDLAKIELLNENQKLVYNIVIERIEKNQPATIFVDGSAEALDRTLKDIMECNNPFGGKVIVFGRDFHQILPVILKGSHTQIVNATLKSSTLWSNMEIFYLNQNMRVEDDLESNNFKDFLIRIGNGTEKTIGDDMIRIPDNMIIKWHDEESLQTLIKSTYPSLQTQFLDSSYFTDKIILTTKNEHVDYINNIILENYQEIAQHT
ncbi:15231_t:CDS:2, partial [Racocetra fulgida]